jgi:hypothetical protein
MRLKDIDLSKPKRLSLQRIQPKPVPPPDEPKAPKVTAGGYYTEEEQLLSFMAANNRAIGDLLSRFKLRSTRTGQQLRISPVVTLTAQLLEPEQMFSRGEVIARIKKQGYTTEEAEALLPLITLQDGASYSYPEPPGRIWRLRTTTGLNFWASNSTPF